MEGFFVLRPRPGIARFARCTVGQTWENYRSEAESKGKRSSSSRFDERSLVSEANVSELGARGAREVRDHLSARWRRTKSSEALERSPRPGSRTKYSEATGQEVRGCRAIPGRISNNPRLHRGVGAFYLKTGNSSLRSLYRGLGMGKLWERSGIEGKSLHRSCESMNEV
jgi:hypothetical protein